MFFSFNYSFLTQFQSQTEMKGKIYIIKNSKDKLEVNKLILLAESLRIYNYLINKVL